MEIKAPDGTSIYRGNGKETTDFTVNIRESGVNYLYVQNGYSGGLTPLLDADEYGVVRLEKRKEK